MEEYIEKNQLKEKLRSLFKYESFPIADIEQIIDWLPVMPQKAYNDGYYDGYRDGVYGKAYQIKGGGEE